MRKNLLLVISGPSGVGKDTLIKKLLRKEKEIRLSISYTTRKKRRNEKNGVDYFFKTKDEFERMIRENRLIEYAKVNDDYYGTSYEFIKKNFNKGYDVILEIDTQGALQIKKKFKDAILIFINTTSLQELKRRLLKRKTENKKEIKKRITLAKKELKYIQYYDYIITNDNIKEAVNKLNSIIIAERCRVI